MLRKILLGMLFGVGCVYGSHVGITQIVEHPTLNKVRMGVIDELQAAKLEGLTMEFANAHGDVGTSVQIAQKFVGSKADVIVAITTPSAQAAVKASKGRVPVVFGTVTDPEGAKLMLPNVAGTSNRTPVKEQMKMMKRVRPGLKTVGVILNYGEDNSVKQLKAAEGYLNALGVNVKTSAVDNSSGVLMAVKRLMGSVDVIYLMLDNTVASALPVLLKVTREHGVPVFSSFVEAVESGALMGLALDEYDIGRETGKIVLRILKGEKAEDIGVVDPQKVMFAINKKEAERYGVSEEVMKEADVIY